MIFISVSLHCNCHPYPYITTKEDSYHASPTPLLSNTTSAMNILEHTASEPSTLNIPIEDTSPISNICDDVYDHYEAEVRRRAWILVKKKVEYRLKDVELDNETRDQLEKELLEDLEDTIQEKLSEHRSSKTMDDMNNNEARSLSR